MKLSKKCHSYGNTILATPEFTKGERILSYPVEGGEFTKGDFSTSATLVLCIVLTRNNLLTTSFRPNDSEWRNPACRFTSLWMAGRLLMNTNKLCIIGVIVL